eukprot:TRINITY_DN8524_c0_g1_i8.p1 TRINITY_DN8524_c0_g1~~TRINITY_DN8524_c0_g1_i8.p1  ORF type:complete len:234 (+),score=49.00 TRINITY_DN8524_c0_g1_i8:75-776(+)
MCIRDRLEAVKEQLARQEARKETVDAGVEANLDSRVMSEQKGNQAKNSTILQTEYLKLLKQIRTQNKETENKSQNLTELLKLTEIIARNKQKVKGTITKRKPNKTCQSMTAMDFNTTTRVSNIKTKTRASSRLGQTCRKAESSKEKIKARGSSISSAAIRTERSLRSVTNKIERPAKPELFLSAKEVHSKRNRSHAQTSDNPSTQLEGQKRSTQSLMRLTSRIFNQKNKDYAL